MPQTARLDILYSLNILYFIVKSHGPYKSNFNTAFSVSRSNRYFF